MCTFFLSRPLPNFHAPLRVCRSARLDGESSRLETCAYFYESTRVRVGHGWCRLLAVYLCDVAAGQQSSNMQPLMFWFCSEPLFFSDAGDVCLQAIRVCSLVCSRTNGSACITSAGSARSWEGRTMAHTQTISRTLMRASTRSGSWCVCVVHAFCVLLVRDGLCCFR